MKNLFKKPWFTGSLMIGLMLLVFFLNLSIMSLNLTTPYSNENFWSLSSELSQGAFVNIYGFIFVILFYVSILPILLSAYSLLRKNNWGFIVSIVTFLGFETLLIVFQSILKYLSIFALVLTIVSFVLIVVMFVLLIFRTKALQETREQERDEKDIKLTSTKIPLYVLLIDVFAILVLITTFFIPLYALIYPNTTYFSILINVLFMGDTQIENIIYFLFNFVFFMSIILYFAHCLSNYFYNKERFINKSKNLITYTAVATLMFFLMGLAMHMYYTLQGNTAQTYAFIPMLLMAFVIFAFSIFKGKFDAYQQKVYHDVTITYPKVEPLIYVIILSAITGILLIVSIIKINITSGMYTNTINLTGLDILRDYVNLDPAYRLVAFMLVVMFISSGISLLVALSSYFAKYSRFSDIVKTATAVNIFFVFLIGVSGYYFQIGQEIDRVIIMNIFDFYNINLPSDLTYEYNISTDAVYALVAAISILILMFIRKAFDRDQLSLSNENALALDNASDQGQSVSASNSIEDDVYGNFDPSPAFTVIDMNKDLYIEDVTKRKQLQVEEASLNKLINFIVDYARNSRLHLSYTPEDIATFVSGLGASKLSILQGMSGTGKTSLPKIFSEAVFGNCEIIEVESSWKDKNELLGYYNEFSMKYTPKKFTIALYKAALNQEIFTFILLDEMNLSRIEYYFSDFLSLMENEADQRELKLINIKLDRKVDGESVEYLALENGNTLKVPPNVWFIGTANRDESTFVISDKVYDRAHTMNFTKRAPKVRNYTEPMSKQFYDYETMNQLFESAKQNGDFDAENSELIKQVEVLLAPFNISFGNRILKQIEDFVNIYKACFPDENVESEAIEKILLSKVVAKLEVKTIDDKEQLEMAFEKLNLNQCVDFIKRLDSE